MRTFLKTSVISAAVLFLVLVVVDSAYGQGGGRQNAVGRRIDDFNKQSDKAARDEMTLEMSGRKPTAEERRAVAAKKAQMNADLESLQSAYNEIVTKLHAKEAISEKFVQEVTERVSKSGASLRKNLELPEPKKDPESKVDPASEQTVSLRLLCVQIYAFLTSPIFETGVLDILPAVQARENLDKLIKTADSLRHQVKN